MVEVLTETWNVLGGEIYGVLEILNMLHLVLRPKAINDIIRDASMI